MFAFLLISGGITSDTLPCTRLRVTPRRRTPHAYRSYHLFDRHIGDSGVDKNLHKCIENQYVLQMDAVLGSRKQRELLQMHWFISRWPYHPPARAVNSLLIAKKIDCSANPDTSFVLTFMCSRFLSPALRKFPPIHITVSFVYSVLFNVFPCPFVRSLTNVRYRCPFCFA